MILRKKVAGLSGRALEDFAERARRAARVRGEVNILIAGDEDLRRLNRRFRGKDQPTDVLSFPGQGDSLAGDIAISLDTGARNARLLGHSLGEELKVLVLHGMLHLAGYDHENDGGEMARRELGLRRRLGLPVGLIERSAPRIPPGTASRRVAQRRRKHR